MAKKTSQTVKDDREFEVDGKKYRINEPTGRQFREARKIYTKELTQGINEKLMLRSQLKAVAEKNGIWNDTQEAEYEELRIKLRDAEATLERGGIELEDAKKCAMDIMKLRQELITLRAPINELDAITAEGIAESLRNDFLLSECLVDEAGKKYFNDLDDFYNKQNDIVAIFAAFKFNQLLFNLTDDLFDQLPEYKFLKEFKFMDDQYNLVEDKEKAELNEDKKVVRKPFLKDGKPINKE